jgi:galactofuranosylgalactofuranosylrhamnosyl-N-acetylglucosaminyl-diphospho-decaprenol beta-1,5/1,6-galactofuranosyltransferase
MDAKWYRLARYDAAVVSMPDGTSAALYQRDPELFRDLLARTVTAPLVPGNLR